MRYLTIPQQRHQYHKRIWYGLYRRDINLEQAFMCIFGQVPDSDLLIDFQQTAHDQMKKYVPQYAAECREMLREKLDEELAGEE